MLTLYHNDMSTCSQKVRFALAEKELDWESRTLDLRAGDQQKPEYLALNPNGVAPTLVDDGRVVIESTVINEYIDDAYSPGSLRPAEAIGRARMRQWTKQLDEGVHAATGVLSTCIAFRHQHLAIKSRDEIEAYLQAMPDAAKRERQTRNIFDGVESPFFAGALKRFDKLVGDMDAALAEGTCLAGDTFSLADVAYAPYAVRLDHLQLGLLWDRRPHVAGWYARIRARPAYKAAFVDWFNPRYLPLMAEKGQEVQPRIRAILAGS